MKVRNLSLVVALTAVAAHGAAQSPPSSTQTATAVPGRMTFEVASIKRNVSGDPDASIRIQPGGQMTVSNNSLYNLIRNAYGTQRFEMIPGPKLPSWIDSDKWDILAKSPAGAPEVQEQMQLRLRSLLEDRFKLVARREMREMPVYELVVARSDGLLGRQIKPSGDECAAQGRARAAGEPPPPMPPGGFCGTRTGNGSVSMKGVPLSNFVRNLGGMTGRFVIDKTGLTGPFDLDLKWAPEPAPGAPPQGPGTPGDDASLFAAIQEQLGLKLEAKREPVEVLVIDSAERPTED
jgi:bla regulator protein blaR1